ncbi:hypothetical protein QTI51_37905 [Variovorax sp. J22G73]|uniref:hypothetical protein n=1 Tax=unclassified Variovorax TaxID=663243 RepID=UPI0025769687|nr:MULTISPECIES: hypothetical protein [unclassified Variovorax]MDM0010573.1 hypothetical protein [Variovorax sp. J22R203]MDM0103098.1 hypothetical protein [Variovorax sp. J22G73]
MAMLKRHAAQLILLIALLLAMTPVWRWAALPASPTFEEVSQLICIAPRAEAELTVLPISGDTSMKGSGDEQAQ